MESFKTGYVVGNGAAINIELGWVPDRCEVYNHTDGDKLTTAYLDNWVIPFSGGGVAEIAVGDTITGLTNTGVTAIIKQVELYSGSWAGGDAAGFFIVHRDDLDGTFGSENVEVNDSGNDDATITINVIQCFSTDAEVAGETGNTALAGYVGVSGSNSKGFTIGSTVAEEAKLLVWSAWRNDR